MPSLYPTRQDDNPDYGEYLEQDEEIIQKPSDSVSAIILDFDYVTGDPDKSRADEIRVLSVKNKKQPKDSKDKKPPGKGWPTGGVESGESFEKAAARETRGESGYTVSRVLGKLFQEAKPHIPNNVHVFLAEADSTYVVPIKERDEVDQTYENWITLREAFQLPYAIAKDGTPRDPNGIYYAHIRRLVKALNIILFSDLEQLPKNIVSWVDRHEDELLSAMSDLLRDGVVWISEDGLIELPKKE